LLCCVVYFVQDLVVIIRCDEVVRVLCVFQTRGALFPLIGPSFSLQNLIRFLLLFMFLSSVSSILCYSLYFPRKHHCVSFFFFLTATFFNFFYFTIKIDFITFFKKIILIVMSCVCFFFLNIVYCKFLYIKKSQITNDSTGLTCLTLGMYCPIMCWNLTNIVI